MTHLKDKHKQVYEAVVIGTSFGGLSALSTILSGLSSQFSLAIIIVQHMHPQSDGALVQILAAKTKLNVQEAGSGDSIQSGTIHLAPANYHLLVEENKTLVLSSDDKVHYSRPSIDVLFESAAFTYGSKLIAIVLTGANSDGAMGIESIKKAGGLVIVQDPKTSEVDTMPKAAIATGKADYVLPLIAITQLLNEISERKINE